MNLELETLAKAYVQSLVEYHAMQQHCRTSDLQQDKAAFRKATTEMCNALNALDEACAKAASQQLA